MYRALSRIRVVCTVLAVLLQACGVARAADRPPNVILVMPDQMRGQAMGVAGNDQVHTPYLNQLAKEGLYLPNTIANNPVCCPARATIMTGTYPHRHGLTINDLRLRESERTLAEVFADAGYATGFVGKWHLDGGKRLPGFVPPGPRRQGFQFWAANQCDHRHFNSHYFRDDDQAIPITRFEVEIWMDESIRFIRANQDRPFFLWYACGPPHNPYGAPPSFEELYDPGKLVMRSNWQEGTEFGSRKDVARYYAAISAIDEQMGRLMRVLDELNLAEDTVVLFTSDHGDMLGSQESCFKCKPFEESIRVPGILRYPKRIKTNKRSHMLFSHVDFAPTLLGICDLAVPEWMQGRDLSLQLTGSGKESETVERGTGLGDDAVFLQIYEPRHQTHVPEAWRGVRTSRYTYARFQDRPWCLYDLEADPYQLKNLVNDAGYENTKRRLDALVEAEMVRSGDSWGFNCTEHVTMYRGEAKYRPDCGAADVVGETGEEAPPRTIR